MQIYNVIMPLKAEREVNMRKTTKRRLSSLLCAVLMLVTSIDVTAFAAESKASTRKIDVWDMGTVQEADTDKYNNHITAADWENCDNVSKDGKFVAGETTFGDLTINHNANDRLFSASSKNYGSNALATTAYDDGYTASGMYYCNGTGGEGRRYIAINNVEAGDKIVVYMASSNAANGTLLFKYLGEDNEQVEKASFTNKGAKYEFVAKYSGSYKVYTDAAAGKPIYNRVVRIPGVKVSGTIEGVQVSGLKVLFKDDVNDITYDADVKGNTFTATLAAGCDYTAVLSGVAGYGFSVDTKNVTTTVDEALTGKTGVTLKVEEKKVYTYTGKVTGFAADYDTSGLSVKLVADPSSLADDVVLKLDDNKAFKATLEPDVKYTVELSGVNDYEVTDGKEVTGQTDYSKDISVSAKKLYKVTGRFTDIDAKAAVTDIKFINVDDKYVYTGKVTSDGYEVSLRNGSYEVEAAVDGYRTTTHIVVNDADVTKDILMVSTKDKEQIERASDIYVGYKEKGNANYNTVKEAVSAVSLMTPAPDENNGVTIHIAPGTYREQVIISTPYVRLVNDEKSSGKEVLLTWYYGIGYKYYSIDSKGYYNAENAYDKYEKAAAAKWGCSVLLKNTATGFSADGITFEASFNRYLTDEEIEDGVTPAENKNPDRNYATDVTSKAATERATAMAIEADKVEFTDCEFLGSQDTLYTGNSATNMYFKNCRIEGNTDYIFGDGNAVFDGCELRFAGYSAGSAGGYITAHKPASAAATKIGYVFRNCTITGSDKLEVSAGYLGRPWGQDAKVTFLNTKINGSYIKDEGWFEMSGNKPEKAGYTEYNSVYTDGTAVDVSKRVTGVTTDESVAKKDVVNDYLSGWTPNAYVADEGTVAFVKKPYLVDNGDINAPYPGHTFTVIYSLGEKNDKNDASVIRWYIVNEDGSRTLAKSSTANADNTYKISKDAIGKHIEVEVVPENLSGVKSGAVKYKAEAYVRDGYEDPTGSTDIELGDGVNVFLAGDSTVKDYSASGMYMSGKAQAEGSWGEYLQAFFDSSKVKVQNYANGGRSSQNFINEGSLDKIKANIKAGDYLFIQFGHNDCANGKGYIEDRYVPLGQPDADGIYPVTAGTKVATPSSLTSKYGDTFYSYDCGGTYKWYLKQYIDAAKEAGAIPVLVTPVSRLYYTSEGTIKPHHDSTDKETGTLVTENNAYVEAVKQLAKEQDVLLIDGFEITKNMYEEAYKADEKAANGKSVNGTQVMSAGDSTHSNKLGGFITAELFAQQIQNMNISLSKAVKSPSRVAGVNPDGQQVFVVDKNGVLTAKAADANGRFTEDAVYWTTKGQSLLGAISAKSEELNKRENPTPAPDPTPAPNPTPAPEQGGSDKKDDGATSDSDSNKDDNAISSDDKNPDASKDDVKTADVYHVMGYSVAFTMALAGIVLLVYEDRKKKRLINK